MRRTSTNDWPSTYEFRINGYLSKDRFPWLADLDVVELSNGETLLTGELEDLAALYGLLSRMRDLGLLLLSVKRLKESARAGEEPFVVEESKHADKPK